MAICKEPKCFFANKIMQNCASATYAAKVQSKSACQKDKNILQCLCVEGYRSGHNGADSKSVWEQSHAGSNPALSATKNASFVYQKVRFLNDVFRLHGT